VKVRYVGTLPDGKVFDQTAADPVEFRLGQVIEGWNEGVRLMTVGSKYRFVIPSDLAYGDKGTPDGTIPPKTTLTFEIELVEVKEAAPLPEPPKFHAFDDSKCKTADTGVKYEITCAGKGKKPGEADTCLFHFALYGPNKELLYATEAAGGEPNQLPIKDLGTRTQLAFLRAMLPEMTEGETRFCEVPASQAFGERGNGAVPGGATTYWELRLVRIASPLPLPEFVLPAAEVLKSTASGLKYEMVKEGTGAAPTITSKVEVHYAGWLENGTNFDSSFSRGLTTEFPITKVIRGWTEGLQLMKEGGVARFVIPPGLAYGPMGFGDKVPQNATLVFYIELVKVK
jgi:FKBP-type peptidyl-prolyl cis-trans isomerase